MMQDLQPIARSIVRTQVGSEAGCSLAQTLQGDGKDDASRGLQNSLLEHLLRQRV